MKKRREAFKNAFRGVRIFINETTHARFHLAATAVVCLASYFYEISPVEWGLVLLCVALVLSLEAVNSALEYVVDLVSPDYNELAKKSKDVAAAAVLIASFFSVVIALLIFIPKI